MFSDAFAGVFKYAKRAIEPVTSVILPATVPSRTTSTRSSSKAPALETPKVVSEDKPKAAASKRAASKKPAAAKKEVAKKEEPKAKAAARPKRAVAAKK